MSKPRASWLSTSQAAALREALRIMPKQLQSPAHNGLPYDEPRERAEQNTEAFGATLGAKGEGAALPTSYAELADLLEAQLKETNR